jgi:hypothetical protein
MGRRCSYTRVTWAGTGAFGAQHDEELARQLADVTRPARGVLPSGEVAVEARFGGSFSELLFQDGWGADEP